MGGGDQGTGAEDYELPVTARLIIARRVPIYERTVTDVERRRTNSEGDIYNLRGRRVGWKWGGVPFSEACSRKDLGVFYSLSETS